MAFQCQKECTQNKLGKRMGVLGVFWFIRGFRDPFTS